MAIIGGGKPTAPRHYRSPAEELHENVLAAFDDASLLTRLALAQALEQGTPWEDLAPAVRELYQRVTVGMGISD